MRIYLLLLIIGLSGACKKKAGPSLQGEWVAFEALEEDRHMQLDAEEIKLQLGPNGRYQFESTLNYTEAGRYYLLGEMLYTTDTTRQNTTEKVMKIERQGSDTLLILMRNQGKALLLRMERTDKNI